MMPEQQQRILGYFIEEAKDHLNTIEQGLLSLQKTIEDTEMVNEVFRAAHSIKGGAAMLGIESVQRTSHRLEDYFKVLKESPIQTDRTLESMFLQVFDGLQSLVEELQGPFGLTEDKAQEVMGDIEPVFEQLEKHLNSLVDQAEESGIAAEPVAAAAQSRSVQPLSAAHTEESALRLVFRSDVPGHLRDMLRLFKQADNAESRAALQKSCDALLRVGEQFDLTSWCELMRFASQAVGNPEQTYRALAPVIIKDIKQAQEWVLGGRAAEIGPSNAMQALLPPPDMTSPEPSSDDLDVLLDNALSEPEAPDLADLFTDNVTTSSGTTNAEGDLGELLAADDLGADNLSGEITAATDDLGDLFAEDALNSDAAAAADETESTADSDFGDLFEIDSPAENDLSAVSADQDDLADLFQSESLPDAAELSLEADDDWLAAPEPAPESAEAPLNNDASVDSGLQTPSDVDLGDDLLVQSQGPEVGAAELNSLADLFEGEMAETPWQEESEVSHEASTDKTDIDIEISHEFSDLLLAESDTPELDGSDTTSQEELVNLFGDVSFDEEGALPDAETPDEAIAADLGPDLELGSDDSGAASDDLHQMFGDIDLDDVDESPEVSTPDVLDQVDAEPDADEFGNLFDDTDVTGDSGGEPATESSSDDFGDLFETSPSDGTSEPEALLDISLPGDETSSPAESLSEADEEFGDLFDASPAVADGPSTPTVDLADAGAADLPEFSLDALDEDSPIEGATEISADLSLDDDLAQALPNDFDAADQDANDVDLNSLGTVDLDGITDDHSVVADPASELDLPDNIVEEPAALEVECGFRFRFLWGVRSQS
jgi:chemotaxis protein histidine kinase CheA